MKTLAERKEEKKGKELVREYQELSGDEVTVEMAKEQSNFGTIHLLLGSFIIVPMIFIGERFFPELVSTVILGLCTVWVLSGILIASLETAPAT